MELTSITEKQLYEFLSKGEATIDDIRTKLGEKHVGALGKLMRAGLVEKYKKRKAEDSGYSKMVAYYGIKQCSNCEDCQCNKGE